MADSHVFAGVVRWPGGASMAAPPGTLGGVFRLPLGGTEWEHVTRGLPEECHVPCLTVDPHDPARIYAGTQEGPYLSTDGGASWREAPSAALPDAAEMGSFVNRVMRFAFNPERPEEMWAALEVRGVI